jgi:hypothetical protein
MKLISQDFGHYLSRCARRDACSIFSPPRSTTPLYPWSGKRASCRVRPHQQTQTNCTRQPWINLGSTSLSPPSCIRKVPSFICPSFHQCSKSHTYNSTWALMNSGRPLGRHPLKSSTQLVGSPLSHARSTGFARWRAAGQSRISLPCCG